MEDSEREISRQLELVHWHLLRNDQLRVSIAARAGSIMGANTLVVGGVAIILTLGEQRPSVPALAGSLSALLCVAVSAVAASMALITLRQWHVHFTEPGWRRSFVYNSVRVDDVNDLESFRDRFLRQSDARRLDDALNELWRCGLLHDYRYKRLRLASQALLLSIAFLVVGVAGSAF